MARNERCAECADRNKYLFCSMDAEELRKLESLGTAVRYDRGATIYREGYRCESVYVLCAGRVKLWTANESGRTLILKVASAGQVLGLTAALSGHPHEVTAEAIEACRVRAIQREQFVAFLDGNREAALRAAKLICNEYIAALTEMRRVALPSSASARVANLLLDWTREEGRETGGQRQCNLPLTHEEIASMAATSRETVTRVLGRLRRDRLIRLQGASLTVLEPRALERLAE